MRLTDYLPHGPAMSTPPSERVRDVLTARHRKANALFSRTGFALIICIFVSMTSALPTFGHKTWPIRNGEDIHFEGNPFDQGTENWQNYEGWREFIATHPNPEYSHTKTHWHMATGKDEIGGWDKCITEWYDEETDDYDTSKCPDGTSTNPITPPPPDPDEAPVFNGPSTARVPENTLTTEVLLTVSATDSDSQDHVTYSKSGADASKFSLNSSGELRFSIVPDYENPQDSGTNNVYVVEVIATSGTGDRIRETTKTLTVTVTDVNEPPGRPNAPTVSADSETSLDVSWTEPTNKGPPIHDYDYRYRTSSPQGSWTEVTTTPIGVPSTTISPLAPNTLTPNTAYDVQVRANNPEGTSDWSTEGTGTTGATDPNNAAPRFLRPAKSITENSTSVLDKVEAEDADIQDSVTDYEIVGGADREQFEEENIVLSTVPLTAELRFKTAPDYENEQDANRDNVYEVIVRATSGTGGRIKHTYQTITVTVTNVQEPDDPVNPPVITDTTPGGTGGGSPSGTPLSPLPEDVTVSFTRTRYAASEDDEAVTFIVRLSAAVSQDAVVEYATSSGTARAGQDYEATTGTLTFPAGTTRLAILVPIIDDNVVEEEETFTISLRNSNATIGEGKATGAIADNDLPLISVKAEPAAVEEGGTIKFTLTRIGAFNLNRALEVPIRVTERGAFLGDIDVLPTEATFAANETTATLLVETVDDEVAEANGSVSLTITRGETYRLGDAFIATAEVIDNDGAEGVGTRDDLEVESDVTVSFAATRYEASEGDRVLDFAVRLSTATLQEVTVQYATVTGTATAGMDYAARTGILTFPAATTEQTIRVPIIDDNVVEQEETFTVSLRRAFNAKIEVGKATGVIADNDLRVVVSIAANQTAVTEGGTAAFTLTRVGELTAPLTVSVSVTAFGSFLTDEVPTAATFAANAATATLLVTTDDDGHIEANGSVTATITSGAYQIGDAASATVVVIDNDVRGVTVTPTALTIREGSSSSYMVGLDTEPTADVTVAVQVPEGAEISVTPTALTFTAANWNAKQLVVVTAAQDDDTVADDPLTIRHAVSGGDYGAVIAPSVAVTILEDDPAIRIADAAVVEGAGEMAFSVRLSVPSIQTVTVDWTTADGTAIAGQDYEAATGTLTFSALATAQTIRVPIIDDNLDEAAETFTVALRNSNVAIADGEATGVIADNDLPVVNLTTDLAGVVEGETVAFTLTRVGDLTVPLRVPVRVTERGSFLADGVPTAATFAANAATTTLQVATDDDERDEADGAVTATITSGPTHRVGDAASATVTVTDNDVTDVTDVTVPAGVTVNPTVLAVPEGGSANYTVVLDSEPTADVTVAIQVPEEAEVSVDETELTFTTEDWNQAQTVTVTAAQDDDAVADDTVVLTHEVRGGNYDTVTAASVAVTILEDDMSALSVANVVASEGDGEMAFSVRLNLASSQTVTVEYVTAGGTATAGRDYETTTGTLTFSALETEQTIRVPIIDDDIDEAVETLTVMLINASNAEIKDDKATGIITDDDERGVTVTPTALMIREGDSASYTVVLDSEPTADVTVEIQVPEDVEVAVDVTKLTFTAEDWNQSQTVTVTAAQDADAVADDPVTLTHVVSGGDYRSVTVASVAVTILEDDTPTLLIADAEASEGDGEMAFAVRLSVPSSQTVTVEYATADGTALAGTDYEETTGTLIFSAETTVQTIRVPIIDDDLDEVAEAFTVALSNPSNATIEDGEATSVITDNDLPVVSVTTDLTGVEEGGTVAFTLTRIGDLTGTLTVPVDVTERGAFLADGAPTEVTFAVDAATTALLVATDDDDVDEVNGAVTATITSGTTHRAGESNSATVSVTDNDERGVTVTPTELTVEEGGSGSYTVVLDTEPAADVTVEIQVPDNADIVVDKTGLTFTADNWNTPQTIAVTAAQDDDAVADDPVTITHAVSGGDYEGVAALGVEVTIIEDDTAGGTISITALEVAEGDTGRYAIVLDTEPTADVTVEIQVPEDTDIAVSPLTLTFTADNWNTPQTVTVTATQDDDAVADDPVTLTHAVSGGDYEGVTTAGVEVTIIEDDTTGVTISITALEISEGDTGRYTLVLDTEPTADVTIAIQVPENADIAVSPLTLTFTADNWNTPQTVTVTATQDDDAVADDPVTLTHAVSGGDYEDVTAADVEVTIIEDDTTGVTISITALEISEGDTGRYTLVLDTEPTADVTVEIQVPEDTDIAVDKTALTFTADNWNTPQTITVTAVQDDDAVTDDPVTLTHIVSGGDYEDVAAAGVEVTITEDDTAGVTISTDVLEVSEGSSQSYTIVLDTEPAADVTVEIQVPENAEIAVDKTALTFTADNWNTPQTITVTAAQDDDAVTDDPVTITHAVSGGDYEGVTAAEVEVTIIEDDTTGVTISITALEISEGDTGRYTLVLDTEPAADVTVEIQMPEDAEIAVSPLALTFTAANWNTPQTVAVTADQDDDAIDDNPVTLTHIVSGGDYEGVTAADVEVTIIEDDTTGVTISITALEVAEGDTGRYTLVLDTEPTADVTVEIQVPENADIAVSPLTLTFTADNWNTPQTVTVTAAQDDDAVADDPVTLTHAVSGGDYQDVTAANVEVTIIEDDTTGVTISITALEISEGDTGRYTLVLDTEPTADVTVEIQVPEDTEIAVSPLMLTFTADNWNTPQAVAVTAAQDDDAVTDDPVTITHIVSGGDYEDVTALGVEVTITEDDTAGVTISTDALEVSEGSSQSYTVVLGTEPAADVMVVVAVPEDAEVAVSPLTLTFTADNWNTPQTVAVTAAHDDDAIDDDPVTLTHAVSGGDYEGVTAADVEVSIIEDDTPGVTVSETALTIPEGDSQSYMVVLDTEPAADVMVMVAVPEDVEVAVDETTLTFTAANWNTPQTVAVTAAHDDDAIDDDPVTLTHTVSGGDYEGVSASEVTVTITEDDTPALTIADANSTEGDGQITFTVRLNVASSLAVTVDWATADDTATQGADYAETTGTLTFDALETEQTITVPLLDDALDENDETFTVALTNAANATLDDAEATGTIADNDDTPALTIADAEAAEGDGEITFAVTLGAASSLEVTVDWTTADGTATADADYVAADGRLTFAPGQTEATIAVAVFNDALDEGDETVAVALSNPTNATIAEGTATGTITDDDPSVEKAWLTRFGRTTASQVMDAVSDRLTGRSGGDAHLTVGGQRVTLASGQGLANAVDRTVPAKNASSADVLSQHPFYHLTRSSFADIISRSSFQVSSAKPSEEQGARWTAWGRGATTRFRSEEVDLSLTGGAATGLLGGDWQQGRMLAGLAVAHSSGTGEFDVHTAEQAFRKGELGTYLTSVHPYLRVAVTERLSAWGLFGYGRGQMERMGDRPDTDIGMQMGGLGARGALLSPTESSDFDVALKSDAFLVRMDTDAVIQPALETMTSRLRLQLEGGRPVELESGRMSPSLEVGVRHDGGDAETGLGLEVGGSLGYTHAQRGLALQATARRLLVHQANGYEEWGVGGSLSLDPGALGRGPTLRMQSSWGATSGMDRLWSQRSAADLARSAQAAGAGLFDAELGYGLDALGGLLTPYAHVASSGQGPRTYGLGGRLQVERSLRVDLVGERRERTAARAGHELKLRSTLYW